MHIYCLFFQRSTEKKALPCFHSSTVNVNKSSFPPLQSIRSLCWKYISILSLLILLSSSFFYVDTWKACYLCLNLKVQVRLVLASTRPRLMLFETGNVTSVDHHHHRAGLALLLQGSWLLCAGLSSLQCFTSGIVKWMLKAHSMQDPLLPTSPLEQRVYHILQGAHWMASHNCNAIPLGSLNGLTVLVFLREGN